MKDYKRLSDPLNWELQAFSRASALHVDLHTESRTMKIGMLNKLLDELEKFLRTRDGFQASLIQEVRGLFKGFDNTTLTAFGKKVDKWKPEGGRGETSRALRNFQNLLAECGTLFQVSGAKAAAADLRSIATFFDGCTHDSVTTFVVSARSALSLQKSTKARSSKSDELRMDLVRSYADQLAVVHEDIKAFERVAGRLEADRKVRAKEMWEIAKRYCGYELPGKSTKYRGKALDRIRRHHVIDGQRELRKIANHMPPW